MSLKLPTVAEIESKLQNRPAPAFSESRWPYTYACDLLRTHPEVVPNKVHNAIFTGSVVIESRGSATIVRMAWAKLIDPEHPEDADDQLVRVLALVHCNLEQIEVPARLAEEVSDAQAQD